MNIIVLCFPMMGPRVTMHISNDESMIVGILRVRVPKVTTTSIIGLFSMLTNYYVRCLMTNNFRGQTNIRMACFPLIRGYNKNSSFNSRCIDFSMYYQEQFYDSGREI